MTNRQKRAWRKERYFKRQTMRYIRTTIKSLPEQDFSPNIEKYHVWDIISNVITIVTLVIISIVYYFVRENNLIIVATYAIFETFSVSTGVFYLSHQTSRDKTESLLASLGANVLLNNAGQTTQGFKHRRCSMAKMVITSNICIFFCINSLRAMSIARNI